MRTNHVMGTDSQGVHQMTYYEWGDADNPKVLLCVHGLLRNGRDFDDLATALSSKYRVLCPDMVGRGLSDYLTDAQDYATHTYIADLMMLLTQLGITELDFLGTSMGGIIGMALAVMENSPVKRLILNDIGPYVAREALLRIIAYSEKGSQRTFGDLKTVERYLQKTYASYAELTAAQWQRLAQNAVKQTEDQRYHLAYDPKITTNVILAANHNVPLWPLWCMLTCPILLLHAARSDVLTADTVAKMQQLQPTLQLVEIAHMTHPVSLMYPQEIAIISNWLI